VVRSGFGVGVVVLGLVGCVLMFSVVVVCLWFGRCVVVCGVLSLWRFRGVWVVCWGVFWVLVGWVRFFYASFGLCGVGLLRIGVFCVGGGGVFVAGVCCSGVWCWAAVLAVGGVAGSCGCGFDAHSGCGVAAGVGVVFVGCGFVWWRVVWRVFCSCLVGSVSSWFGWCGGFVGCFWAGVAVVWFGVRSGCWGGWSGVVSVFCFG